MKPTTRALTNGLMAALFLLLIGITEPRDGLGIAFCAAWSVLVVVQIGLMAMALIEWREEINRHD